MEITKRYLSVKECAEYTGLSIPTLYRWSVERRVPFHKIGHILRFDIKEIDKWFTKFKQSVLREQVIKDDSKNGLTILSNDSIISNSEIRESGDPERRNEI